MAEKRSRANSRVHLDGLSLTSLANQMQHPRRLSRQAQVRVPQLYGHVASRIVAGRDEAERPGGLAELEDVFLQRFGRVRADRVLEAVGTTEAIRAEAAMLTNLDGPLGLHAHNAQRRADGARELDPVDLQIRRFDHAQSLKTRPWTQILREAPRTILLTAFTAYNSSYAYFHGMGRPSDIDSSTSVGGFLDLVAAFDQRWPWFSTVASALVASFGTAWGIFELTRGARAARVLAAERREAEAIYIPQYPGQQYSSRQALTGDVLPGIVLADAPVSSSPSILRSQLVVEAPSALLDLHTLQVREIIAAASRQFGFLHNINWETLGVNERLQELEDTISPDRPLTISERNKLYILLGIEYQDGELVRSKGALFNDLVRLAFAGKEAKDRAENAASEEAGMFTRLFARADKAFGLVRDALRVQVLDATTDLQTV